MIAVGERRRGDDRRIGDAHAVMRLVLLLEAAQDGDRFLNRRLGDVDWLEVPRQRPVFLDMFLVLVGRGDPDAVQFAARERGPEQVGRVHRLRLACADEGVHLVDEQDDPSVRGGHLLQHSLQSLLGLAAVLCASDQRANVEREQILVVEAFRHVAVDDAQRQPFYDRGLADAPLADQYCAVLNPAGEHLNDAVHFLVTPDQRVELAVARRLGEVARIFLQRVISVLGRTRIRGAALAQRLDHGVEILRRDANPFEDFACLVVLLDRERKQQSLDRYEGIARLLRKLFRGVEHTRERWLDIKLAGPAALNPWALLQRRLDVGQGHAGAPAGTVDQPGCEALRVVEQRLEEVLGSELLVSLAQRKRLRPLNKSAGSVGVFVEIHDRPSRRLAKMGRTLCKEEHD